MVPSALFPDKVTLFGLQVECLSLGVLVLHPTQPRLPFGLPFGLPLPCLQQTTRLQPREKLRDHCSPHSLAGGVWAPVTLGMVAVTLRQDYILGSLSWVPWGLEDRWATSSARLEAPYLQEETEAVCPAQR